MKDIKIMLDKHIKYGSKINIYTRKGQYFNITKFKFIQNNRILIANGARISVRNIYRVEEIKNDWNRATRKNNTVPKKDNKKPRKCERHIKL